MATHTLSRQGVNAIHPDAALLRLGEDLDRAAAICATGDTLPEEICTDELIDALMRPVNEVIDRIEKSTATTMEGLMVQVRAMGWCSHWEPFATNRIYDGAHLCTNMRLALVIANALMAMATQTSAQRAPTLTPTPPADAQLPFMLGALIERLIAIADTSPRTR